MTAASRFVSLHDLHPKRLDIPILILTAFILLVTGLSLPLLKIQQMIFWKSNYSVFSGVIDLFQHGDYALAALIFFFSVLFPFVKLLLLFVLWEVKLNEDKRRLIIRWLGALGKWSMLDVFIVAIIVVIVKIGPLAKTEAQPGIYFFTASIFLSLVTAMLIESLAYKTARG